MLGLIFKLNVRYLFALLLSAKATVAVADPVVDEARLNEAVKAQAEGDNQKAVELYEQLIAGGHINGHVYFNLGNAYYRLGKAGAASGAYLAARRYLPRSPDVSANLSYARREAVDKLAPRLARPWWAVPALWSEYFTPKELATAVAVCIALGSILWFFALYLVSAASALRWAGLMCWIAAMIVGYGFTVQRYAAMGWGAVTAEQTDVYSFPGETGAKVLFQLHEAAPVAIQQQQGDWYQIAISDGKQGWLPRSRLKYYR